MLIITGWTNTGTTVIASPPGNARYRKAFSFPASLIGHCSPAASCVGLRSAFVIPESPRWHLRRGHTRAAADLVNRIISRSGNRVPPLTIEALGGVEHTARDNL